MRRSIVASALASVLASTGMIAALAVPLQSQPKVTTIFQLFGHHVDYPAPTRDGKRIYYQRDSSDVYMYDRTTRQHTRVFAGRAIDGEVSAASDRLVFVRAAEGSTDRHVWTVELDPRTGLATGSPHRVSLTTGNFPSFSPDGHSIAFSAGSLGEVNDLVVVPTAGGPERVLVRKHGWITPVRWSADGRSLLYGSNTRTSVRGAINATFRVPVAGGTPERVLDNADWGGYPGLSPDGRTLLTRTKDWDSVAISSADGKRIAAYAPGRAQPEPEIWIDGAHGLDYDNRAPTVMTVLSLDGSKVTTRFATKEAMSLGTGKWSPDAKLLAAFSLEAGMAQALAVFDSTGGMKLLRTPERMIINPNWSAWSPDGRRVAYKAAGSTGQMSIRVVELSTGRDRVLATRFARSLPIRWTSDGEALIYGVLDTLAAADSTRVMEIRQVALTGADKLRRKTTTRCALNATPCFRYLNDSTILMAKGLEYRVLALSGNAESTLLFTRERPGQGNPSVSENGRWIALREPAGNETWNVHVLSSDGATRKSVRLPEVPAPGQFNPFVSDDGSELIVSSSPSATSGGNIYRIAVATGVATKIYSLPPNAMGPGRQAFSPDGKSMLFSVPLESRGTVYEIDLSPLLRSVPAVPR